MRESEPAWQLLVAAGNLLGESRIWDVPGLPEPAYRPVSGFARGGAP